MLQQELTAVTEQLAAAARPYGFEPADAQDLLDRLQPQPDDTTPASEARREAICPAEDAAEPAAQSVAAPAEVADYSVGTASTAQQHNDEGPDADEAGVGVTRADYPLPIKAAAAAAAEILVGDRPTGLVPSASRARLEEGYAGDSDSSVSVLKLSQSAADMAATVQLNPHEALGTAAAAATEHDLEVKAAAIPHEEQGPTHEAAQAEDSEQPPLEDAEAPGQHHENAMQQAPVAHSSNGTSSHLPDPQGQQDARASAERADASAAYASNGADAVDSRTESSADGLTPSVSRTYLEGYAADSDTSIGGQNRHAAHSTSAGPLGSDSQAARPVRAKGAAVSPIPEGEQLPTGVPEELPPPAPSLSMLDRHDSGNLADAEDELPGDQQSHHMATVSHVEAADDSSRGAARTSDVVPGSHQPSAGTSDVEAEHAGMFAGLDLA